MIYTPEYGHYILQIQQQLFFYSDFFCLLYTCLLFTLTLNNSIYVQTQMLKIKTSVNIIQFQISDTLHFVMLVYLSIIIYTWTSLNVKGNFQVYLKRISK